MKTKHKILFQDSRDLANIKSESVDLIVTSPPYPMIQMWDNIFSKLNLKIEDSLNTEKSILAFELMHKELDKTWQESYRTLKNGGIACINIGDATRTINDRFQLFSNHSRILESCTKIGFHCLPEILWRKRTNAPNKFMGSGMLPVGAYVTLEHEHILILRKNNRRHFNYIDEKRMRSESAFFWEERNSWFSDIWEDIRGTNQKKYELETNRRNASFPIDIPYRLINMFSIKGDVVLDPYLGIGTTTMAAMLSERNSIGIEIDKNFKNTIFKRIRDDSMIYNEYVLNRLNKHSDFIKKRAGEKGKSSFKYINKKYQFPVMTKQEIDMTFNKIREIKETNTGEFEILYDILSINQNQTQ